jgi:hypothetical protein
MEVKLYDQCIVPLESRGAEPPTREYIRWLVKFIKETDIGATWHAAVDHHSRPLFPSKVFSNGHPDGTHEAFRHLTDAVHRLGRPILSWYSLNHCQGLLDDHPKWSMKVYEIAGVELDPAWASRYVCFNSPFGKMLPEFSAEVVRDLGFDGIWFDGSHMSNGNNGLKKDANCEYPWPVFVPGCKCDFCRDRFKRDTGLTLPDKLNFKNRTFRQWINWRYDVVMDLWQRATDAVMAVNPKGTVMFNNYRRRHQGAFHWTTGIPLRTLRGKMGISGEADNFCGQVDFQIKMNQAYQCERKPATHWVLLDHWNWGPDVETLPAVQATLGAFSAGGNIEVGYTKKEPIVKMVQAAEKAKPFLDGTPVEYAAILCSQQSQDFFGQADPRSAWDEWHGANEVCLQGHVQSSIIFDDYLDRGELDDYPILIVGNAVCMSKKQAHNLDRYVRAGGTLLACHQVGELDELGYPHKRPVLDNLLGIRSRKMGSTNNPILEFSDRELETAAGKHVTCECWSWLRQKDKKTPPVLPKIGKDVQVLGNLIERQAKPETRSPGVWIRKVGKGRVAYCSVNIFLNYLRAPTPHMLRFLTALMNKLAKPKIVLTGPMCVSMNCRVQADGRWAVHLHNAPGSAFRYPAPAECNYLHSPGEVVPVYNLKLNLHGSKVSKARSGISGKTLKVIDQGRGVEIPSLELHEVVILTLR